MLETTDEFPTTGTVTIASATPPLAGTFDVTFADGHINGSVAAVGC